MKAASCQSMRQRAAGTSSAAAHKTSIVPSAVPSSGRGGPASTSGRGQFTLASPRVGRLSQRDVQNAAAAIQQGGLGLSDLLDTDLTEPVLTPRRIMNRRIKSCRSPGSLADLVVDEIANFDHQNVAHALSRLAKMAQRRGGAGRPHARPPTATARQQQQLSELQPALELLTKRMHQLIRNYDSWDVTLSLWSYAQLGYHDEAALRALCEAALAITPLFKPADCANAAVAFAYLDFLPTELLRQIVAVVLDTIDDFQPGEICQVLWGFAKLGCHPGATLLHEAVAAVHRRVRQYSTQELVLVLWALVRLGHKPGVRFLYDMETTLLQRLPHMAPVDLSLSVWTFGHLRYKAVRLLDEVPAAVGPQLRNCSNAELCSLVSGFATAHHYHRVLLEAVSGVVLSRLDSLTHQEVCVVLWTYGTFRHRPTHADFSKQMAATLYSRMPYFAPQGLAMIVKALAQLQWRSEPLMVALMAAAETKLNAFKPLEMSQLLWGLSSLECKDLAIYYAVVRRCIAILKDPTHPHYSTMLHHRVVNSVISSCQQLGYVPWTLIDFAESKGIRVKEPDILSSRDEDDEGMLVQAPAPSSPSAANGRDRPAGTPAAVVAWSEEEVEEEVVVVGRSPAMDHNDGRQGQEQEECDDVGHSAAAALATSLVSGRRLQPSTASDGLRVLEQQPEAQHAQHERDPALGSGQERRRHPVDAPTPLDQHAPLRVGIPPHHGHHGHHGRSPGYAHQHGYPQASGGGNNGDGGEAGTKMLIPRPKAGRRAAAGAPTAAAAAQSAAADPQGEPVGSVQETQPQEQQGGRHRPHRHGAAPGARSSCLPGPPPPLPLQPLGVLTNGNGNGNGNGSLNGSGRPEAPFLALER